MKQRITGLARFLLVIATMGAWVAISNHCVLGGLIAPGAKTSVAPMHCHGDRPAPSKSGDEPTPCCKVLKAITMAKVHAGPDQGDSALTKYPTGESVVKVWQAHMATLEVDTGPPKAVSFSESVLQRSLLAHAPPLSLS